MGLILCERPFRERSTTSLAKPPVDLGALCTAFNGDKSSTYNGVDHNVFYALVEINTMRAEPRKINRRKRRNNMILYTT